MLMRIICVRAGETGYSVFTTPGFSSPLITVYGGLCRVDLVYCILELVAECSFLVGRHRRGSKARIAGNTCRHGVMTKVFLPVPGLPWVAQKR